MTTPADLGQGQSPIDISDWIESEAAAPTFEYASDAARVERSQGFVMIHFDRGSEVRVGGESYRLLQLHWHTPAEHTIDGEEFAAEAHFVHVNEQEELLVVAALYVLGPADEKMQRIIEESGDDDSDVGAVPALSAVDHTPESDGFYHYVGSLTAAPFSEPVLWYVGRDVRAVSERQVEQLQSLTGGPNARPLQERLGRAVLCVGCQS